MKVKKFTEFLNEFELEGETVPPTRYTGTSQEVINKCIRDLDKELNQRHPSQIIEENDRYIIYNMEETGLQVGVSLPIEDILYITITFPSNNQFDETQISLNKLNLGDYILDDTSRNNNYIGLVIPVTVIE